MSVYPLNLATSALIDREHVTRERAEAHARTAVTAEDWRLVAIDRADADAMKAEINFRRGQVAAE
jgi:hypothetical protein